MQRAQRRKYHYIYKTTCIITNRFYIGMHSTDNLEDGYIGSGKRLWHSINKHGKDNHIKEILEFLPDRESLKAREREIVNQEMLNEELCMNLKLGGEGGNTSIDGTPIGGDKFKAANVYWNLPENREKNRLRASETLKKLWLTPEYRNKKLSAINPFSGKTHSEASKQKMREKASERKGNKNSQFGTCWITNEIESKKILKGDSIPEGWRLGRKIK